MKKFTHRYILVEYSGIHWNPLESSWNRWGTLKYWAPTLSVAAALAQSRLIAIADAGLELSQTELT